MKHPTEKFEASVVKLQLLNMIAKYPSDRKFYVWHLVYLDRLFLLSNLTWRRAHATARQLAGIQM